MRKILLAIAVLACAAASARATDAPSPITPERARAILGFLGSATLRFDQIGLALEIVQALNAVAAAPTPNVAAAPSTPPSRKPEDH